MSWELIHSCLLHPSESVMKAMFRHKTLHGLPKHCPKKIHKAPCTICYTEKMTTINKGTTVDTSNLQTAELVYMESVFYKITYIHGFTYMIKVICEKTRMIWVLPTESKIVPVCIIILILKTLMN